MGMKLVKWGKWGGHSVYLMLSRNQVPWVLVK